MERQRRSETTIFVICGLFGLVGAWIWTHNIGAVLVILGLAALIGECTIALTGRLDNIAQNLYRSESDS